MSVYEFLSVDIDTDIDAKMSISGGKDGRFGSLYLISTLFYVDIKENRRYRRYCNNENVDIGIIMSISGTISYIIYRFELTLIVPDIV